MVSTSESSALMDIFLDFGETMMFAGAEIGRIEDSLARMGRAYGAEKTNVFVITSSIELTITFRDGESITRTRRIRTGGTDFEKLRKLNSLSRRCAADRLPVDQLRQELVKIQNSRIHRWKFYLGGVIAASSFSLFFGGSLLDALLSGSFALFVSWLEERFADICPNKIFFLFVSSLLTGIGICMVAKAVPIVHIDKIIIGDIMLLVPGISITNAVRDTLIGDTISGVTKLADSLVWAAALAAGFMIAIRLFVG
jgi:uncharacterized membrane protein YjjP (DUF1212 family)